MPGFPRASQLIVLAGITASLVLTGCSTARTVDAASGAAATAVRVTLTNDGCVAEPAEIPAGPVTFNIRNEGGSAVSEAELVIGTKILGEKEGLTPGLSGSLSLNLAAGEYELYCPHAATERSPVKVTGGPVANASTSTAARALLAKATTDYRDYVERQATELISRTEQFAASVKSGDVLKAKALYAKVRAPYETVEPVAESFGDLDPDIDAREGDVPTTAWRGFHRIEKQLWIANNTTGMAPVVDKLVADVRRLAVKIKTTVFQPAQLANGASELLNEVAKSKLTGEEERYSRTDIVDIDANLEGSQAAFDLLVPALKEADAQLVSTIKSKFSDVRALMQKYALGNGDYRPYTALSVPQIKEVTVAVDALAEPLSRVGERIVTLQ
jgi:iron uptake system component EfeO